jgi:hypothetical protein
MLAWIRLRQPFIPFVHNLFYNIVFITGALQILATLSTIVDQLSLNSKGMLPVWILWAYVWRSFWSGHGNASSQETQRQLK